MEREAIKVLSGAEYDHLFPKALLTTIVKKKDATVSDTIKLIPQIVRETRWQAMKLAKVLKADTLEKTCRNIWEFVYNHIAYRKDENGKEQVRSFARTWHDRHNFMRDEKGDEVPGGVDCDCGTTFISTLLSAMGIRHALRIVKFWTQNYSHIYPIVPLTGGGHITIDFVVDRFNYEEPFSEKHDTKMELEYLNGVYSSDLKTAEALQMAGVYQDEEAFGELGKLFKKKISIPKVTIPKIPIKDVFKPGGLKEVAKDVKNITNKLNPAVIPLRLGLLAAMKINFMKIGSRIKYAYLTDAEAQKRGVDMTKFNRLKQIKDKLESIFFQAGGQPGAIKEAVLKGAGNKNNDVLAGLGYSPENLMGVNGSTPLSALLGQMYFDEISGINGLGALGEPVTAATITAATGALTAIAALLKSVGNLFPKKSKEAKDFEEATPGTSTDETTGATMPMIKEGLDTPNTQATDLAPSNYSSGSSSGGNTTTTEENSSSNLPSVNTEDVQTKSSQPAANDQTTGTFWQKNKSWIIPTGIGTAVLITIGTVIAFKKSKPVNVAHGFAGIPQSKKKNKKKGGAKPKIKSTKKQVVSFIS